MPHAGRVIGSTGEFSHEHWIVPVHGLTPADPEGTAKAIAHRDGTVSLHSTCGQSRTTVRFDACRAAQLPRNLGGPAGAAQQLTTALGDGQPSPPQPPDESEDRHA
jgi:hypothetical protein